MWSLTVAAAVLAMQSSPVQQQGGPPPTPDAVAADTGMLRHATKKTPPIAFASRLGPGREAQVHIDGKLNEPVWSQARPASEFTQTVPHEGEPATERTEVRISFDDEAVYVAARLFDSDPAGVHRQLSRRDAFTESDLFEVAFDSYHDHNTSFVFGMNPSGVKSDRIVGNDGFSSDDGWDPVWEGAARVDSAGWTV